MSGLKLIYGADQRSARAGQTLFFTAWVVNETKRSIHNIELVSGSFTNEALTDLQYIGSPTADELRIGRLGPGQSTQRSWAYTVTPSDVVHGGEILSCMSVHGTSWLRALRDEHDAFVIMLKANEQETLTFNRAWPERSTQ
ncbi:hypothetical protein AB4Y88_00040 [Paenarthrobacter sp. RAF9]